MLWFVLKFDVHLLAALVVHLWELLFWFEHDPLQVAIADLKESDDIFGANVMIQYLYFHLEIWFICIKIAGIEPTNNYIPSLTDE